MYIPDRLSIDKDSPYFNESISYKIGDIFINGILCECLEYCISEGWVVCRVFNDQGTLFIENDGFKTVRITGKVEVYPAE